MCYSPPPPPYRPSIDSLWCCFRNTIVFRPVPRAEVFSVLPIRAKEQVLTHTGEKPKLNSFLTTFAPLNTAPPNTAALPIPPPIFKSQIWVLYVMYDSQYRHFWNTAAFSPVPRSAVLRGLTVPVYYAYSAPAEPLNHIDHSLISRTKPWGMFMLRILSTFNVIKNKEYHFCTSLFKEANQKKRHEMK